MWIREERLEKYQYLYYWKKFFESKNYTIWENILKMFWMEVEFLNGFKCYQILRVVKRCSAFKVKHEFGKKKEKEIGAETERWEEAARARGSEQQGMGCCRGQSCKVDAK